jgi:hypothetical protein
MAYSLIRELLNGRDLDDILTLLSLSREELQAAIRDPHWQVEYRYQYELAKKAQLRTLDMVIMHVDAFCATLS